MPIGDLVYNSDLVNPCGCINAADTNGGATEKIYVVMPPPPTKFPLYPYPPEYPNPYDKDVDLGTVAKQSDVEKQICKLSKKASTLRALINSIEEKNKSVIVKSATYSYNLGEYKTPDADDPEVMNEDENIGSILEILKAELELVKSKIKDLSDQITTEP